MRGMWLREVVTNDVAHEGWSMLCRSDVGKKMEDGAKMGSRWADHHSSIGDGYTKDIVLTDSSR